LKHPALWRRATYTQLDGYSGGYTYMYSKGGQLEGWSQSLHLFIFFPFYTNSIYCGVFLQVANRLSCTVRCWGSTPSAYSTQHTEIGWQL